MIYSHNSIQNVEEVYNSFKNMPISLSALTIQLKFYLYFYY